MSLESYTYPEPGTALEREKLVVVGNGMVGQKVLATVTAADSERRFEITAFAEEPRPAYDRVHLSAYFTTQNAEALSLAPLAWFAEQGVTLHLGDGVAAIDREHKTVTTHRGKVLPYDKLVLATGSAPFIPPVPGIEKTGVFAYRTIEDLDAIIAYGKRCTRAAVIGGGLLGLEAAKALTDMGLHTHVVEFAPRLMPRQLDEKGAALLKKKIEALGVQVHLNKNSKEVLGDGKVEGLEFTDGETLDVEMILVSAGIRPRDELAKAAGLEVGPRGGILINERLETTDPDIYAVGECALSGGMVYGLVAPGYRMAEAVTEQLLGREATFTGADLSTKLKLMGIDVASIGDSVSQDETLDETVVMNARAGVYKKLLIGPDNTLKGAVLVGDASDYGNLLQLYLNKLPMLDVPESLLVAASGEAVSAGVAALPDTATICSCENVSKGAIALAVQGGAQDVAALKGCTKAGTCCGSCVPLVKDILELELTRLGVTVDKSLCEHFAYTRQELFEIVKTTGVRTFEGLLETHGQGLGCEVCKPAVASVLASIYNAPVMELPTIQDTNDAFMANIQKNGSYSVVPRVPGGEILPEQLIVMGQVAQRYGLYTKITGGQRIDLFGARREDLPHIWEELAAVGLESGHAYAKALRTVKSCVGLSWCRYGVQDSTALAIEIENRYKGLRSPHKIKMAVSGCARECAEAQSKDVGVIATEGGWNLYVCGNGGMKPQHAALLASDLGKETLVRYIDRFLMYYVRTADRLERTATWLNKLPGGLAKVYEVVVEDKLGIAAALEAEMAHVKDTYACEWQGALNDPATRARFSPFINTAETDASVQFEMVRAQPQPL